MISEEGSDKVTAGSKSSVNTTSLADWPSLLLFDPGDGCRAGRLRFHRRGLGVSGRLLDLSRVCSGGGTPPTGEGQVLHPFWRTMASAESARVWQGPPPAACGSGNFYFPGNLGVSAKSLQMSLPPAPFLPLSPLFALLSHSLPASSLLISLNRAPSRPVPSTGSAKLETQLMTPCSPHLALPTGEYTC